MGNFGWKLAKAGATMAAAFVAERAISAAWKGVTGHKPPQDPEDPDVKLGDAIAFAAITGVIVSIVRVFAARAAAKAYAHSIDGPAPWTIEDDNH